VEEPSSPTILEGTWSLLKFKPGFSPTYEYNEDLILWTFRNNKLIVKIDSSIKDLLIKANGEYEFSLRDDKIVIDENEYFYVLKDEGLIIHNDPASDGFQANFVKK